MKRNASVDQSQEDRLAALEQENGELKLDVATLIRVLVAKGSFTADEFARFVDIIDGEDGQADGKLDGGVV